VTSHKLKNRGVHLKRKPKTITYYGTKMKSEAGPPPRIILSPNLPRDTRIKVAWLLGRCSRQLRKRCARANMVYSRAQRVLILEHYFAQKSFSRTDFKQCISFNWIRPQEFKIVIGSVLLSVKGFMCSS
jgi:hypothetical protein